MCLQRWGAEAGEEVMAPRERLARLILINDRLAPSLDSIKD